MRQQFFPSSVPQHVREDPEFRAEIKVFDLLKEQIEKKKKNLIVFHDNAWIKRVNYTDKNKQNVSYWGEGQSDFIVFSEEFGIINFEVKGGIISFENGEWFTTTLKGKKSKLKEPPIRQTSRNKYALRDLILEKLNRLEGKKVYSRENLRINFQHAVSFPDTAFNQSLFERAECDESIVFTEDKNEELAERLLFLLKDVVASNAPNTFHKPGKEILGIIKGLFSNSINEELARSDHMRIMKNRLEEAESEQKGLIDQTRDIPKILYTGGAGTGKTFLALSKAKLAAEDNKRVLFLGPNPYFINNIRYSEEFQNLDKLIYFASPAGLYNSLIGLDTNILYERIKDVQKNYQDLDAKLQDDAVQGMWNMMVEAAIWSMPLIKSDTQTLFERQYLPRIEEAIEKLYENRKLDEEKHLFDYIIIDEAQDFSVSFINSIQLLLRNSNQGISLFMDNNQRIKSGEREDLYEEFKNQGFQPINLNKNYRNTKSIYRLSKNFYEGDKMTCSGPEGMKVKFVEAESPFEIKLKTIAEVIFLTNQGMSDIGILHGNKSIETWEAAIKEGTGLYLTEKVKRDSNKKDLFTTYPYTRKFWKAIFNQEHGVEFDLIPTDEGFTTEPSLFDTQKFFITSKNIKIPVMPSGSRAGVVYDNIMNFKGLEKEIIILLDIDESMDLDEVIYVGLSRAKCQLTIISGNTVINRLKNLIY